MLQNVSWKYKTLSSLERLERMERSEVKNIWREQKKNEKCNYLNGERKEVKRVT